MGPLFSNAKWTCELAIKWTQRQKSTGKSPHFSGSTVHGPRPHFIDTRNTNARCKAKKLQQHMDNKHTTEYDKGFVEILFLFFYRANSVWAI